MLIAKDSTAKLYVNFINQDGSSATISGVPTVGVGREQAGSINWSFSGVGMSQIYDSRYGYEYHIPARTKETDYLVVYEAEYTDGTNVVGTETMRVVDRKFFEFRGGGFSRPFPKDTWKPKEKDELIRVVKDLLKISKELVLPIDNSEIFSNLNKMDDKIDVLKNSLDSLDIFEEVKPILENINKQKQAITSILQDETMKLNRVEDEVLKFKEEYKDITKNISELGDVVACLLDDDQMEEVVNEIRRKNPGKVQQKEESA